MDANDHSTGFPGTPGDARRQYIGDVFDRAAGHYDLMNDVMSLGAHRIWKRALACRAAPKEGERWLDLACGSGDVTCLLATSEAASVVGADPSGRMLALAKERLARLGDKVNLVRCGAEDLPFDDWSFDGVCCAFGLRNFTDLEAGLCEIERVLAPGGRFFALEFSRPCAALAPFHRRYLLEALPALGDAVADDARSYHYLGESILAHPDQKSLAAMMERSGFAQVTWTDMAAGAVAIHRGWSVS